MEWCVCTVQTSTSVTGAQSLEKPSGISQNWLPEGPQEDVCVPWLSLSPLAFTVHWLMMVSQGANTSVLCICTCTNGDQAAASEREKEDRRCPSAHHRTMHISHGMRQR